MPGFTLRTTQRMTPLTTPQSSLILVSKDVSHFITCGIFFTFFVTVMQIVFVLCFLVC